MDKKILVIAGPTAVGKTKLAIEIAEKIGAEIVSADSMQIYQGLDIGTAKPTAEVRSKVKHHMMDFLSPDKKFSVAQYVEKADECIESIFSKGLTPIVVGGTGLYIDSLIYNNDFGDFEVDMSLRESLNKQIEKEGGKELLKQLSEVDPETAARLHENDIRRIVRALEIYHTTGKSQSFYVKNSRTKTPRYSFLYVVLSFSSRELLYERINKRVDIMLNEGLLEEARGVVTSSWYEKSTASQAIGYKEFLPYFNGETSLGECVALLKQHSRNYAKRQLTWFRHNEDALFFNVDTDEDYQEKIINLFTENK